MTQYNITKKVCTSWFLTAFSKRDVPLHHTLKNEKEIVQKVPVH